LDVAVFGPLKTYYNQACDSFMVNNLGRTITDYDIGKLFCDSYNQTANVGNAVKGFKACGIEPFNHNIFSDFDFLSAAVTERPFIQEQLPNTEHTLELISQKEGNTPILSHGNECNTPTSSGVLGGIRVYTAYPKCICRSERIAFEIYTISRYTRIVYIYRIPAYTDKIINMQY